MITANDLRGIMAMMPAFTTKDGDRPDAEDTIGELFAGQMRDVERRVVVVDNALPRAFADEREDGTALIGGDNSSWEFSAFDRAIEFVGADIWSYDFVHFATSAFNTLYVAYLDRFTSPLLTAASGRPACIGHIDCYNEPVGIGPFVSQHWLRSCFFFTTPAQVRALGTFVSVPDPSRLFSGDPASPFRADAPVSETYRRYVIDWLIGADIGQGVTWHSRTSLTPEGLPTFEFKAASIFNEHLLSIRLRAQGCPVVDVTWLSTLIGRAGPIPWNTNWRQQLASRDRDAIAVA